MGAAEDNLLEAEDGTSAALLWPLAILSVALLAVGHAQCLPRMAAVTCP